MTKASSFFLRPEPTNPKTQQFGWRHPRNCGDFVKSLLHSLAATICIVSRAGRSDSLDRLHRNR